MTIYFEYNEAVGTIHRPKFGAIIASVKAAISEVLLPRVNGSWVINSSIEREPSLAFALGHLSDKARIDNRSLLRFVLFAYSEDESTTASAKGHLKNWPQNAKGVIVVVGDDKAKEFFNGLQRTVNDSRSAKDKILVTAAEAVAHGSPKSIVTHLIEKR